MRGDKVLVVRRFAFLFPTLALVLSGCSAVQGLSGQSTPRAKPTAFVSVASNAGPSSGATVAVLGTTTSAQTDTTGNAHITGLGTGTYQLKASLAGYASETLPSRSRQPATGNPDPTQMTLGIAPPAGIFYYQPKSTLWLVLDITSADPQVGSYSTYEWGCGLQHWTVHQPALVNYDPSTSVITFGDKTTPVVGPSQLHAGCTEGRPKIDPSQNIEPTGACNGVARRSGDRANAVVIRDR
jgi:hypothetical protein